MAEDREILREIWEGKLPVCFRLSQEEVNTMQQPEPYYLMIPRLSYFPLVMDKVHKHFSRHVDEKYQNSEMWIEHNGQPLKWHIPIGVLFDQYGSDSPLPWNITIHFQNFPEAELLRWPSRGEVEAHFMSMVKEADALKHRSQVISIMQKKDHNQLWMGLQNDKFDQFWAINKKLMEKTSGEFFKNIPFKIYMADAHYVQRLVSPVASSGEKATLEDLIKQVAPEELEESSNCVLTHGIKVPLETPLQWMSEHLSYPDNFLHLCVVSIS